MEKIVRYCDHCGVEGAARLSYFITREMDAAGDTDDRYEDVDLCLQGAITLLGKVQAALKKEDLSRTRFISMVDTLCIETKKKAG